MCSVLSSVANVCICACTLDHMIIHPAGRDHTPPIPRVLGRRLVPVLLPRPHRPQVPHLYRSQHAGQCPAPFSRREAIHRYILCTFRVVAVYLSMLVLYCPFPMLLFPRIARHMPSLRSLLPARSTPSQRSSKGRKSPPPSWSKSSSPPSCR